MKLIISEFKKTTTNYNLTATYNKYNYNFEIFCDGISHMWLL